MNEIVGDHNLKKSAKICIVKKDGNMPTVKGPLKGSPNVRNPCFSI